MPTSNSYSLSPTILMPTILSAQLTTHYLEYAQSMLSRCLAPALAMQLLTIQVVDGTLFGLDLDRPVLKRSRKAVSYSSDHLGNSKVIHSTNTQQTPSLRFGPPRSKDFPPRWQYEALYRFLQPLEIRAASKRTSTSSYTSPWPSPPQTPTKIEIESQSQSRSETPNTTITLPTPTSSMSTILQHTVHIPSSSHLTRKHSVQPRCRKGVFRDKV
ncbi:hypothetical protein BDP27DRAFT_1425302 [Rhodocollybia butyracea]|uniref:Uncharacterized protein n=1 Tax=Rhodocollybia butyracea TaxID=206335 RepID=A0A9P5U2Q5_9AGAR|nr:hypothetical protein BDP27DRAFT_1425302 [Rhodocollybia butyracea]